MMDQDPQLSSSDRRKRILEQLSEKGSVRVAELSALFQVSEVTIRSDLETLDRQGRLVRDRGGAIARVLTLDSVVFEKRAQESLDQKRRIALAAAGLVADGDRIMMDAGSTLMQMAKSIHDVNGVTVITNALNIAVHLMSATTSHVILTGGSLSRETISTVGVIAERDIDEFRVEKLFMSTHALNAADGLLDNSAEVARVKLTMIGASRKVILLADSAKWGRPGFARVAPLSAVHTMISDTGLSPEARHEIREHGIDLVLV
jgi:DeoR/GlpR family transcriptional regulator of sugar metabolism